MKKIIGGKYCQRKNYSTKELIREEKNARRRNCWKKKTTAKKLLGNKITKELPKKQNVYIEEKFQWKKIARERTKIAKKTNF